jgi:hypothetical protein
MYYGGGPPNLGENAMVKLNALKWVQHGNQHIAAFMHSNIVIWHFVHATGDAPDTESFLIEFNLEPIGSYPTIDDAKKEAAAYALGLIVAAIDCN